MARIIVFGGHGKIALKAEALLAQRGDSVTAAIRNADHAVDVSAAGGNPLIADLEHLTVDELAALIAGHDAVVWSAGAGGGNPARTRAVDHDAAVATMDAAAKAGVRRYVMVSYFGASVNHGVAPDNSFFAYAEAKAAADEHLRASDLDWTILGPSTLTDDDPSGQIDTTAETSGKVSRGNVAQVIAAVLADDTTIGRTIRFNDGSTPIPEALAAR
ncbi:NAD(P)H-binding protein [Gordonia sp. VNK21]|uniref:NAD(P)H-binding protein n=1 Tax=Gordonia sp. VNK21 TaxID=3382483 RepID=UPI0038D4D07A